MLKVTRDPGSLHYSSYSPVFCICFISLAIMTAQAITCKLYVWWRGESKDLSQNEISRYQPFKSNFSPDSEFGIFVVNYSTTIYLSTVKRVFIKTVFKYI